MTLNEAANKLQKHYEELLGVGFVTIGTDKLNTLYVYEHKKTGWKNKRRPNWLPDDIHIVYKYIEEIKLC